MNDSKGSAVVVGDQGPQCGLPGLGVVPDGRGESGEALENPGEDALIGSPTMAFQVELALQGVVHRFDELAQRLQERAVGRDRPHSTGVESITHRSSKNVSVAQANNRIMALSWGIALRTRLL